jgi:hypothetical protein
MCTAGTAGVSFKQAAGGSDASGAVAEQHAGLWGGGLQVQQAASIAKSKYRQQLEDAGQLDVGEYRKVILPCSCGTIAHSVHQCPPPSPPPPPHTALVGSSSCWWWLQYADCVCVLSRKQRALVTWQ